MRTFLQIMREAYLARKAGVSAVVALTSTCSDAEFEVIWERLMKTARLEGSLKKYRPRSARQME